MGNDFRLIPPEKDFETIPPEQKPLMAHPTGGPPKLPDISPFLREGTAQIGAFGKGAFEGLKSTLLNPPAYGGALKLPFTQPQEQLPVVGGKIQFPQDVMPDTGQPPENWQAALVNQLRQLPFVEATEKLVHPTEPYQRAETAGELIGGVAPFLAGSAFGGGGYRPKEGYKNFLRDFIKTKPEFKESIDRLEQRGHLTELSKDIPKNHIEADKSLRTYLNNWEESTIGTAVKQFPNETIDGTGVAQDLGKLKNAQLDTFFPGSDDFIANEQSKYVGKQIPLPLARELLARLNAFADDLEDMSPEDSAAAQRKSIAKTALKTTANSVRNQLYSKLSHLGVKGIEESQRDYGALKELKENIHRSIPRAERQEALKPAYDLDLFRRAVERHPLLTGGVLLGAGYEHSPEMLLALPAIEALTTAKLRSRTPNALLKKAFESYKGGPEVVRPKFEPPAQKLANVPPITKPPEVPPTVTSPTVLRFDPSTGEAIPSVKPFERTNVPQEVPEVVTKPVQEVPEVPQQGQLPPTIPAKKVESFAEQTPQEKVAPETLTNNLIERSLQYAKIKLKDGKTIILKNYRPTGDKFVTGLEIDEEGTILSKKSLKGQAQQQHLIDKSAIKDIEQLALSKKYGNLVPYNESNPDLVKPLTPEQLHKEAMKAVEEEQSKPKGIPVPNEVEEVRRKIKETEEKARKKTESYKTSATVTQEKIDKGDTIVFDRIPIGSYLKAGEEYTVADVGKDIHFINPKTGSGTFDRAKFVNKAKYRIIKKKSKGT